MNEIERARLKPGVSRVAAHDLDVAQTPARDKFRRHRHMHWVGVKPDNPSTGRDPLGQQIDDPPRSAPNIDRDVARPQSHAVEQSQAIGRELLSLTLQAGALATAAAQRVDSVRVIDCRRRRSRFHRRLTGHCTQFRFRHRSLPRSHLSLSATLSRTLARMSRACR